MTWMVRRLDPSDYEVVREVRLRALAEEPTAFGSTHERESRFSDDEWQRRLRADGYPHFGCFSDGGDMVGLVVGGPDETGQGVGNLYAMWVEERARGSGAADGLVGAVVDWAQSQGYAAVQLLVTEGNDRAERMYRRNGFELTGHYQLRERDGVRELVMARATASSTVAAATPDRSR